MIDLDRLTKVGGRKGMVRTVVVATNSAAFMDKIFENFRAVVRLRSARGRKGGARRQAPPSPISQFVMVSEKRAI